MCGSTDLLLGILVLVVLSVAGSIVLRGRVVAGAARRRVSSLTVAGRASTVATSRSAAVTVVWPLRRPEAALWVSVNRGRALPNLGTPPRRDVRPAASDVMSCASTPSPTVTSRSLPCFPELRHQASVLGVEATLDHAWRARGAESCGIRVPVDSAVASHVSGAAANTADDVRCEVALLRTVVLAMPDTTAVLTDLVFVITESTVECCKLAKLVTLVVVLPLRRRGSLSRNISRNFKMCGNRTTHRFDDFVDQPDTKSDLFLRVSSNETVEIFFSILGVLFRSGLALLNATLPPNADLRATVSLHLLQTVPTRADQQSEEIDLGKLLHRNVDLLGGALRSLHLMVLDWRTEIGVVLHGAVDQPDTFLLQLLAVTDLASVSTTTMSIIRRGRRWRPNADRHVSVNWNKVATTTYRSRSGGMKSFKRSLRLISSNRRWIA